MKRITRRDSFSTHPRQFLKSIAAILIVFSVFVVLTTAIPASAQTFTTLLSFDGTDGQWPYLASLAQGADGNLYGTTRQGGVAAGCEGEYGCGTVFRITPDGTLTTIYNFCAQSGCPDGYSPVGSLTLGTDGNFYGTTYGGGANDSGTVFRITPRGALSTLYSFCSQSNCADGVYVNAGLIQATDGNWYGTTFGGGNGGCDGYGCGTVFRITAAGQLTTLYSFPSPNGNPSAPLIQARDGNLYGTTTDAGGSFESTIFMMTLSGTFTTLYQFESSAAVYDGLVQGTDGNFYGTAAEGGSNSNGNCSNGSTCGTVFKVTPGGELTTLYNFCADAGCTDGAVPFSPLIQATNGMFYGMTYAGGTFGGGTIFSISSGGALSTLFSFDGTDGAGSYCGLLQLTNGVIYGTTTYGGASSQGGGVAFNMNVDLAPFVSFVRGSGRVGATVEILGQGFAGTTAVSFNGTPARYSVVSSTFLKATVPTGATTGLVMVDTPSGPLSSNKKFNVMQ